MQSLVESVNNLICLAFCNRWTPDRKIMRSGVQTSPSASDRSTESSNQCCYYWSSRITSARWNRKCLYIYYPKINFYLLRLNPRSLDLHSSARMCSESCSRLEGREPEEEDEGLSLCLGWKRLRVRFMREPYTEFLTNSQICI